MVVNYSRAPNRALQFAGFAPATHQPSQTTSHLGHHPSIGVEDVQTKIGIVLCGETAHLDPGGRARLASHGDVVAHRAEALALCRVEQGRPRKPRKVGVEEALVAARVAGRVGDVAHHVRKQRGVRLEHHDARVEALRVPHHAAEPVAQEQGVQALQRNRVGIQVDDWRKGDGGRVGVGKKGRWE